MRCFCLIALTSILFSPSTHAADWQPGKAPLMTRWAKDVSPTKVHPEYPRPQMVREKWQNLNGLWQLAFAKEGEAPPIGKDLNEQILVPFPVESALSGVMKRADRLWYRRTFSVPKDWANNRVLLHFGAVDWEAKVWVNGKHLGNHRGGYDPFSCDITDALKKEGEQEIIVGVWDPTSDGTQPRGKQVKNPGGIYYTPITGIWQTVWLEPVASKSITGLKFVPNLSKGTVDVTITLRGFGPEDSLRLTIKCPDAPDNVNIGALAATQTVTATLTGGKLRPWSPEDPYLYDVEATLFTNNAENKPHDVVKSYFGLREIAVGKDDTGTTRLLFNGKPVFQVGPLDQGFWPDGLYTAPTDEALKYDIEITKKLGFNMTRKHVKVEPARWYYWCDKLGLLVWQDMPSGEKSVNVGQPDLVRSPESAAQFERELKAMIDGLHNFPCIIMWVPFNEGWGQYDTKRITEWTKKYDPTRLVNCASGWNDHAGVGDVHDIHVYPGPGSPQPEAKRAAVLGEFGGLGLGVDGHTWSKQTWGYRGTASRDDLTRKYERLLARVYQLKDKPGLSAAVYTQITDVETEANGLLTYDRDLIKIDLDRIAAVNRGDVSRIPIAETVIATSKEKPQTWRYTFEKPAADWFKPEFDASTWKEGPGGFGTRMTPGSKIGTEWKTPDIWLRREITLPEMSFANLHLLMHHDENAEVYLNGIPAARVSGFITDYEEFAISEAARAALKPGKNIIAVHCHQTGGGQYIDVGIVEVKSRK